MMPNCQCCSGGGSDCVCILASTIYNPAITGGNITTSNMFSDIDAVNLSVTFTAPASGHILVELEAVNGSIPTIGPGSSSGMWNLRESGINIAGTEGVVSATTEAAFLGDTFSAMRTKFTCDVTGLVAGSVHTYTWGFRVGSEANGDAFSVVYGGALVDGADVVATYAGPASIVVYSAR